MKGIEFICSTNAYSHITEGELDCLHALIGNTCRCMAYLEYEHLVGDL
jgi:aerobic-type carbon monoxide dehydrogenase small subunit (CoxS/CutS family)